MCKRKSVLMTTGVLVLGLLGVSLGHAGGVAEDTNYLTFSGSFAIPGRTLPAGTYIFERAERGVPSVVRVSSRDRKHVYLTAFTRLVNRPDGLPADRLVIMDEAQQGVAPPIRTWFPLGRRLGHEFVYAR